MLINISNHPVATWSEKQIALAQAQWSDVCDVPLPDINPLLDREEVILMAQADVVKYCSHIEQYNEPSAFHVMGESVYCYHIIRLLKSAGYEVVASTTNRRVDYKGKEKISLFDFVKFRAY